LPEKTRTWHYWRGSLELLTQVARVGERAVKQHANATTALEIVVDVDGDQEAFDSPTDFKNELTPEALRRFQQIAIRVDGGDLTAKVQLRWNHAWWKAKKGHDVDVELAVQSTDKPAVKDTFQRLAAAMQRGTTKSGTRWLLPLYLLVCTLCGIAGAAVISTIGYLLGASDSVIWLSFALAQVILIPAGVAFALWIVLPLEVFSPGKSNMARAFKWAIPVVTAILLAGLTKYLYGD
jgi:hypothetical protein